MLRYSYLLIIDFLLFSNLGVAQHPDDGGRIYVSDYLINHEFSTKDKKNHYPEVYLFEKHGMRKDFKLLSTYSAGRKLNTTNCNLSINKYLLGSKTFFEIGKGKLKSDSVVYFSVSGKSTYFIMKNVSSLRLLGYDVSKKVISSVCYKLIDSNKNTAFFSVSIEKYPAYDITQYDYVKGYNN